MKVLNKELVLLDIDDIEEVVSGAVGRKVSISDIDCTLTYFMPFNDKGFNEPSCMHLTFFVNDEEVDAFDVMYNVEEYIFEYKGKKLSLNEPYLEVDCIFNFSVEKFKSFSIDCDSSD